MSYETLCAALEREQLAHDALFAGHVCQGCGCAPVAPAYNVCEDCLQIHAPGWPPQHYEPTEERCAAGVSIGMRALAGRRILDT